MTIKPDSLNLRAFIVCVDFADLLSITLPYNAHHFSEVSVITSHNDEQTRDYALHYGERTGPELIVNLHITDAFYNNGADFNKWLALEQSLDNAGRHGWICLMDVDILWPKDALKGWVPSIGHLYTPRRRMWEDWPSTATWKGDTRCDQYEGYILPDDSQWDRFPLHPQQREFAGYSQIFHGSDPVLTKRVCSGCDGEGSLMYQWAKTRCVETGGTRHFMKDGSWYYRTGDGLEIGFKTIGGPCRQCQGTGHNSTPWHQTDWKHAGGADSFFQALWPDSHKIRPPFEVLHLGPAGVNWCGRAVPYVNGSLPQEANERRQKVRSMIQGRRQSQQTTGDRFRHERIQHEDGGSVGE